MAGFFRPAITLLIITVLVCPAIVTASPQSGPSCTGARAALPAPELLLPANDSWVTERPLVLCWTYPYNGLPINEVSFFIQIDNNQDFTSPEVDTGMEHDTRFTPTSGLSMHGSYFWRVGAKNNTTDISWSEIWKFNLDDGGPIIQRVWVKSNHGCVANQNITVQIIARDFSGLAGIRYSLDGTEWSEWLPYSEAFTLKLGPIDGKYNVYLQVSDRFGHLSEANPIKIILDRVPPAGMVQIDNNSTFTARTSVLLDLPASDANGIRDMMVANNPYFDGASWLKYAPRLNWTLEPGDGWKTVYARFRDPAGLESAVASASIMLDTSPPSCRFTINSGAVHTNSTRVALQMTSGEIAEIDSLIVSDTDDFSKAIWTSFAPTVDHTLPPDDGPKKIYLKVRDIAGNVGPAVNASIILDTSFPETEIAVLPSISANTYFPVSWSGTDGLSGILFYDVEYRQNLGPWTGWLNRTENTRAMFQGAYGNSYSFRVRASDRAKNFEPFLEHPQNGIRVELPLPNVKIEWPVPGTDIHEAFIATGSAGHPKPGTGIERVEYRIDGGPWNAANGSSDWSFKLDISNLGTGKHAFDVRSFGGAKYSQTASRIFYVVKTNSAQEKPPAPLESPFWSQLFALALVFIIVIVVLILARRSKR